MAALTKRMDDNGSGLITVSAIVTRGNAIAQEAAASSIAANASPFEPLASRSFIAAACIAVAFVPWNVIALEAVEFPIVWLRQFRRKMSLI
jgi:hypothetical protein